MSVGFGRALLAFRLVRMLVPARLSREKSVHPSTGLGRTDFSFRAWRIGEGFSAQALLFRTVAFSIVLLIPNAFAQGYVEAPRVLAVLEQGYAAEHGVGIRGNPRLAIELYCAAETMGSSEGFFRIGRMLATGAPRLRNLPLANAYLTLAARLGHREASLLHDPSVPNGRIDEICTDIDQQAGETNFDLDGYIAALIRKRAPHYDVDARMALAIALAESDLDANAVSPKNAQGVMQLIPETQERFGVQRPFDPEQNIKGGLAYLKWLQNRFDGDLVLVAAAYNAGEGTVDRYGDVLPFPETQQYVQRVLEFSGLNRKVLPCSCPRSAPSCACRARP